MSRIAYFDCQFGAAGDMLNAALLAAGLDKHAWETELRKLALGENEFQVQVSDVVRCGIVSKKLDVLNEHGIKFDHLYEAVAETRSGGVSPPSAANRSGGVSPPSEHAHEHDHHHGHDHEHHHHHHHDHDHHHQDDHHDHSHSHEHVHAHRGLREILELIERSSISPDAKHLAERIFTRLAVAEARVHGGKPEDVHFHEVGAVDAIVDIVGFAIGYTLLGIDKGFASGVAIGAGKVKTEHGVYPVPGPATLYLLEEAGALLAPSRIDFECLTPTGAAILCEIVSEWGRQPSMKKIVGTGYGAGTKDPGAWPNVCRVVVGESGEKPSHDSFEHDTVAVLEANIDDMNPQALAYALDRFIAEGALDAFTVPAVMKKGRAGQLLTVMCTETDQSKFQQLMMRETTTIGIRVRRSERAIAPREWCTVQLEHGPVRIKVARSTNGTILNAQPEFDDCANYAQKSGSPVKQVMAEAIAAFRQSSH